MRFRRRRVRPGYINEPGTFHANKLWGRGRVVQLAVRFYHTHIGKHEWSKWQMDAPEDHWGLPVTPDPGTLVLCYRGCLNKDCGTVQQTTIPFREFGDLQYQ